MAEASALRGSIDFFEKIGIYDVLLPFLLVFTIVFAILEKTAVLGREQNGATKKNLNSMAAFVVGFLIVASSQLVGVVTQVSANMVILLMLPVFFIVLIGLFMKTQKGDEGFLSGGLGQFFIAIMFVGIAAIFLHALRTESGETWLAYVLEFGGQYWTSTAAASIVLLLVVAAMMYYITRGTGRSGGGTAHRKQEEKGTEVPGQKPAGDKKEKRQKGGPPAGTQEQFQSDLHGLQELGQRLQDPNLPPEQREALQQEAMRRQAEFEKKYPGALEQMMRRGGG